MSVDSTLDRNRRTPFMDFLGDSLDGLTRQLVGNRKTGHLETGWPQRLFYKGRWIFPQLSTGSES